MPDHALTENTLRLADKYGFAGVIAVLFILAVLVLCANLVRWILKSADNREAAYRAERKEAEERYRLERKEMKDECGEREKRADNREERMANLLNKGLQNLETAAQNLHAQHLVSMSTAQEFRNSMIEANRAQRSEHDVMDDKLDKILNAGCGKPEEK